MSSFVIPSLVQWFVSGFLNEPQNNKEEKSARATEEEVKKAESSEHGKDSTERAASQKLDPQQDTSFYFPGRALDLKEGEYWYRGKKVHSKGWQKNAYDLGGVRYDRKAKKWTQLRFGVSSNKKRSDTKNSDWIIYGKPIYAIADGKVISCWRNAPENPPGDLHEGRQSNPPIIPGGGNFLAVKASNGDVINYSHFQPGSIPEELCPHQDEFLKVDGTSQRDQVSIPSQERPHIKANQFIGLAGNSGNSTNPHLHIHFHRRAGTLPLAFQNNLVTKRDSRNWFNINKEILPPGPILIIPNSLKIPVDAENGYYSISFYDIPPSFVDQEVESLIQVVVELNRVLQPVKLFHKIQWSNKKGVWINGRTITLNKENDAKDSERLVIYLFAHRLYDVHHLEENEEWNNIFQEARKQNITWQGLDARKGSKHLFKDAFYQYYYNADTFFDSILTMNTERERRLGLEIWNYLQESIFDGAVFTSHQYSPANFDEFVAEVIQAEPGDAEKLKTWQNTVSTNLKFFILNTYWKQATSEERESFLHNYDQYWNQEEIRKGLARKFLIEQYPYNDSQALYMQTLSANFPLEELINNPEEGMEVFYEVKEVLESLYIEEAEEIYLQMLVTIYTIMSSYNYDEDFYEREQLEILKTINHDWVFFELNVRARIILAGLLRYDVQNILLGNQSRQAVLPNPLDKRIKARNISWSSEEKDTSFSAIDWRLLILELIEEGRIYHLKEDVAALEKVIFFDPSQTVREKAIRVYGKLMGKEARPLLRKLCLQELGEGRQRDRRLLKIIRNTFSEIREEEQSKRKQERQDRVQNRKSLRSGRRDWR